MWTKLVQIIDNVLFGSLGRLYRANRRVSTKIDQSAAEDFVDDIRVEIPKDELREMLAVSFRRLERIENKAMGTLLGIGIAMAVLGAASGIFGGEGLFVGISKELRTTGAGLLFITIVYLLASGLLALGAYRIGKVYSPTLADYEPVAKSGHEAATILFSIEQNQRMALLRSNRLTSAFLCLRNGLVTIVLFGSLVAYVVQSSGSELCR